MNSSAVLEAFRRVNTAKGRTQTGQFSLEGTRLLERALQAGLSPIHVLLTEKYPQEHPHLITRLRTIGCPITIIPPHTMSTFTQGRGLGDVLALLPLPALFSLKNLWQQQTGTPPIAVVAVDVVDAGNLGAMIRTSHALEATAFIAVGNSDPFHPKAVRTSMGSLLKLPIAHYPTLATLREQLPVGQWVGTVTEGSTLLTEMEFSPQGVVLVMGSEYWGLDAEATAHMDVCVTIPMNAGIDSFSVNSATAITLYEVRRQFLKLSPPTHV